MDWLHDISEVVATETGDDPASLTLTREETDALLTIARIASHSSGDRTNAPLLCYVLGLAGVRSRRLAELVGVIEKAAGTPAS